MKKGLIYFLFSILCATLTTVKAQSIDNSKDTCRLWISFYSIGTGSNQQAKGKLLNYLETYNSAHKIKVEKGETAWGREGEVDYCMTLKGLNKTERKKFVRALKNTLKGEDHIHIEEFKPNIHKR